MSDQNKNEYNNEAPPRQGPEPSIKESGYSGSGNFVTMYHAQQGGGNESFPVLQAFQEYIDAERKQARKRVVQLSIGFAVILGVVVIGFLAAGVTILHNSTNMQTKLMEIVAEKSTAPAQVQPVQVQPVQNSSSALEESIREMSRAMIKMQERSQNIPASAVVPVAEKPVVAVPPSADPAVEALRNELAAMKAQSQKMESELVSLRTKKTVTSQSQSPVAAAGTSKVVEEALARARKTAEEKAAADKAAAAAAIAAAEKKAAEEEKNRIARIEAEKALAVKMAAERVKVDREEAPEVKRVEPVVKEFSSEIKKTPVAQMPAETKEPPVTSPNVKSPGPPKNMTAQNITLKTGRGDSVPWRIYVPE